MSKFNPLWWSKPPTILSYGVSVPSVTAALIIAWWMEFVCNLLLMYRCFSAPSCSVSGLAASDSQSSDERHRSDGRRDGSIPRFTHSILSL
jgi:hypothetical protein